MCLVWIEPNVTLDEVEVLSCGLIWNDFRYFQYLDGFCENKSNGISFPWSRAFLLAMNLSPNDITK